MNISRFLMVSAIVVTFAAPAMAENAASPVPAAPTAASESQRDVNQQERIEAGLKDGQLNTKEAAKLENGEKRIDAVEAKDMKDGTLSAKDKAQIAKMQNKESAEIKDQKHDAQTGNPNSASSQRMQADVARDVNQEKRINEGEKSSALTNKEAGKLEGQQAKADRAEARAGRNGRVGAGEQAKITKRENGDSKRIYGKKHNGRTKS